MTVGPGRRLITAAEFNRMGEAGIFQPGDRLELIEGEIIDMSPIGRRHAACVRRLNNLLTLMLGGQAVVDAQNPVVLGHLCQPQPDLAVFEYRDDFYAGGHPRSEDVVFLVEVADTSLQYDRDSKIPLYARYGIPEVWLVDLNSGTVEVYRDPTSEGYERVTKLEDPDAVVSSQILPQLRLTIREILGSSSPAGRTP